MLVSDPPNPTRLRGLVSSAFTPRTVQTLRAGVVAMVDELIDAFGAGEVDVMHALAFPLPVTVIGEMLGFPAADREQLTPLVRAVTAMFELVVTPEALSAATAANASLESYFTDLMVERRARPKDDLLTRLLEAEYEGD